MSSRHVDKIASREAHSPSESNSSQEIITFATSTSVDLTRELFQAVRTTNSKIETVKGLLEGGDIHSEVQGDIGEHAYPRADVNARDSEGRTPLILALELERDDIVDLICDCSYLDVNAKNSKGRTAFYKAVKTRNLRAFRKLLKRSDVKIFEKGLDGKTAFDKLDKYESRKLSFISTYEAFEKDVKSLEWFNELLKCLVPEAHSFKVLHLAAFFGLERTAGCLRHIPSIRHSDLTTLGYSYFQIAYQEKGRNGDVDEYERTTLEWMEPILHAAYFGHLEIVNGLIEALRTRTQNEREQVFGAKTLAGYTALHLAVMGGHVSIIESLVNACTTDREKRKLLNAKDVIGRTPLHRAVLWCNAPLAKHVLDYCHVDASVEDDDNLTAMQLGALLCGTKTRTESADWYVNSGFLALIESCRFDISVEFQTSEKQRSRAVDERRFRGIIQEQERNFQKLCSGSPCEAPSDPTLRKLLEEEVLPTYHPFCHVPAHQR